MVTGELRGNRPYINILIRWANKIQAITALIDTGFDGDIRISEKQAQDLNLITNHIQLFEFVDGSKKQVPASTAYSDFNGMTGSLDVAVLDGGATIGMGFLKKFDAILKINLKQRSVTIA
ncbi:MAG: hypothetical protein A3E36_04420 [Candidatus Andersenbacteria bacterium RIFCSPHIGHO2_12_FULL_45_11b]|uniref:Peptidase A2 domain-containing protein n=1 Tax=Candidatus Andersenbacteria bacterium RIFCSPHIGHO2_12_FULL_45_11b TaxID=1797282 RepID=A0A1G1X9B1_9BACT|nr:MAG: hypothetical protein A3E36_04420 [Candidatus Andersenbacteria bacterium RIFCSPHIGHO2_12_FULL_45_11b]